jgi:hypothetical protein
MQRRALLRVGVGSAVLLALLGGGYALWQPGWRDGQLSGEAREVFRAVGLAVLEGFWPAPGPERDRAVEAWLDRLDATVAGLSPAVRGELSQLLGLLSLGPGRQMLAGLRPAWSAAPVAQVQEALQAMRVSPKPLRQQAYHALRDLSMAAYFGGADGWARIGYPGPSDI